MKYSQLFLALVGVAHSLRIQNVPANATAPVAKPTTDSYFDNSAFEADFA